MARPISGETMPRKAFCLVSSQISDQLLGIQDHIIGSLRGSAPQPRGLAFASRASLASSASWAAWAACTADRSWSKVATPTTRPWSSTPIATPAGESTAASSAARSESSPTVNVCPKLSVATSASRVLAVESGQPLGRHPAARRQIRFAADDQDPRLAGLEGGRHRRGRGQYRAGRQRQPVGPEERQPPDAPVEPDEPGDVVVGRRAEEPLRRAELGQRAVRVVQRHDVADLDGLLDVVRDQHDRLAQLVLERDQLLLELTADDRVDGAERLVHQQHGRVGRERAGHADPLLLAAGELVRVALGERRVEPDGRQQLPGARPGLGPAPPVEHRHGGDVVLDRAVREQAGLLDDVADAASQPGRVLRPDVVAVEQDAALGRVDEAVDHPQRRGLAAPAGPDENHRLAVGHVQVEIVDRHRPVGVPLRHTFECDQPTPFRAPGKCIPQH